MRRQWNSESAAAISNDRSPNRSRAAALVAAAALLIALAFAVPALASYTFQAKWGSEGSGDGQFKIPAGIATHSSGAVYVADMNNNRIQKFDSTGTFITKWGSKGSGDGQFEQPTRIATDSSGNVYVVDSGNYRIQKFSSTGTFITKWGSSGSGDGQFGQLPNEGPRGPSGIATDSSGNVYVADTRNHRIQKFSSNGAFITKWGSEGTGNGQFEFPTAIAIDTSSNVYVVDVTQYGYGSRVQKFSSTGTFITKWGSSGYDDGQFAEPSAIATDSQGNVYVADGDPGHIQKFNSTGTFITRWGSYGTGDGLIGYPAGIATDASGSVYLADSGNNRIQKFSDTTAPGKARIGKVTVKGPAKVRKGRTYTYKATIQNSGNAEASGVRLVVSGRGIRFNAPVGRINAGATRTVNLRLRPSRTGRVTATFKVTSSNAGSRTVRKTITVRR